LVFYGDKNEKNVIPTVSGEKNHFFSGIREKTAPEGKKWPPDEKSAPKQKK
jgi:hypothetical protein